MPSVAMRGRDRDRCSGQRGESPKLSDCSGLREERALEGTKHAAVGSIPHCRTVADGLRVLGELDRVGQVRLLHAQKDGHRAVGGVDDRLGGRLALLDGERREVAARRDGQYDTRALDEPVGDHLLHVRRHPCVVHLAIVLVEGQERHSATPLTLACAAFEGSCGLWGGAP
eukprot:5470494-Prymnesium_polylepis.2